MANTAACRAEPTAPASSSAAWFRSAGGDHGGEGNLKATVRTLPVTRMDDGRRLMIPELAAAAGLIRSIVNGGPEVGALIDSARKEFSGQAGHAVVSCYLNWLASAFAVSRKGRKVRPLANISGARPFTAHEIDVMPLISMGQSDKRIAAVLEISPETAKLLVQNIFIKLGVDNRIQAVTSGRGQGYFA